MGEASKLGAAHSGNCPFWPWRLRGQAGGAGLSMLSYTGRRCGWVL